MRKKNLVITAIIVCLGCMLFGCGKTEPQGLPKLYFEGNITEMLSKSDVRDIEVKYVDGKKSFECFATLKVQGTSSLNYDKKNYTIKFYEDEEHNNKLGVDVGWGEQTEYCLKANWIDKTHARNIVTANIVTDIQKKYGLFETAPAGGAIDGFPVEIYINEEFLGLYTFNIPKAAWMFAMDEDNPNHIVVCGEGWEPANLFAGVPDFETWSVEVGQEDDQTLTKLKRVFEFVQNSSDEEFVRDFGMYLDLDAVLNYYILADFAYLPDNLGKNMLLATYDGEKWYPLLYDLDTSWGTHYRGLSLWEYEEGMLNLSGNNLFARIEKCFAKELSYRYFELREEILTKQSVMKRFEQFDDSIPEEVFQKEIQKWGEDIPGYDLSQIEHYLDTMIDDLDTKYTNLIGK